MKKEDIAIIAGILLSLLIGALYIFSLQKSYSDLTVDILLVLLAVFSASATFYAYKIQKSRGDPYASRFLWMAVAEIIWLIAELVWAYYEFALNIVNPSLSLADFFWLIGYLPMAYSLYIIFVSISYHRRAAVLAVVSFLVLTALVFIFLTDSIFNTDQPPEVSLVNMAYVLEDALLVSLAIPLAVAFFSYSKSRSWMLLALALGVGAFGDVAFFYLTSLNSPDPNILSSFFYMLDYVWVGIAALIFCLESGPTIERGAGFP